jgi:P2-related tail formation protein
MKPLLLFLISIISFLSSIAQSNSIDDWDKGWLSKTKGKLKSIKVGNRGAGTQIFYYKSNKSIFSIVKRSLHGLDSASSICTNFQNDTLFRVVVTRHLRGGTQGSAIVYLDGNQIIEQKVTGVVFIPPVPTLIDSSSKMLEYAKKVLSWQLK